MVALEGRMSAGARMWMGGAKKQSVYSTKLINYALGLFTTLLALLKSSTAPQWIQEAGGPSATIQEPTSQVRCELSKQFYAFCKMPQGHISTRLPLSRAADMMK
ncbi:hypothetical protein VI817_001949 [Penicillium citrinum]|nr:hypothetical protein VI817_001949 [Penicillium citrinum]